MTGKEFLAEYRRQKRHKSKLTLKAFCEENGRNYDSIKTENYRLKRQKDARRTARLYRKKATP